MVSQTAEYALRAVLCLAEHPQAALTTRRIARATGVSPGYLSKVLHLLRRARLVRSRRGLHGGYTFARPAESVSVLDVVNAVSPLRRFEPMPMRTSACSTQPSAVVERLNTAVDWVEHYLSQTSVRDLLDCRAGDSERVCQTHGHRPVESAGRLCPPADDLQRDLEDW